MKKYLVSRGVLPMAVGRPFFDYTAIPEALSTLAVDGLELVFLPEWDAEHPPLIPTSAEWSKITRK